MLSSLIEVEESRKVMTQTRREAYKPFIESDPKSDCSTFAHNHGRTRLSVLSCINSRTGNTFVRQDVLELLRDAGLARSSLRFDGRYCGSWNTAKDRKANLEYTAVYRKVLNLRAFTIFRPYLY